MTRRGLYRERRVPNPLPGRAAAEGARLSGRRGALAPQEAAGVQPGKATGRTPVWPRARQVAVVHIRPVTIGEMSTRVLTYLETSP
jgi:hypothetical protein